MNPAASVSERFSRSIDFQQVGRRGAHVARHHDDLPEDEGAQRAVQNDIPSHLRFLEPRSYLINDCLNPTACGAPIGQHCPTTRDPL